MVNISNPMMAHQHQAKRRGRKKIKKGVVVHRHKRAESMIMATVVACRLNNTIAEIIADAVKKVST